MVKTGVAVGGAVLSAVGTGLMVGSSLMESFVVVTLPEVSTCDGPDQLAGIGVFTSSYDAACTAGTPSALVYGRIAPLESKPTLEFPLLFPTQNGFGGALGDVPEFTGDCTAYYSTGAAGIRALSGNAAGLGMQGLDASVKEGFADSKVEFSAVSALVSPGVATLAGGLLLEAVSTTVTTFVEQSKAGTQGAIKDTIVAGLKATAGCVGTGEGSAIDDAVNSGAYDTTFTCTGGASIHAVILSKISEFQTGCDAGSTEACSAVSFLNLYQASHPAAPSEYVGILGLNETALVTDQRIATLRAFLPSIRATPGLPVAQVGALTVGMEILDLVMDAGLASDTVAVKVGTKAGAYGAALPNVNSTAGDDLLCTLAALDGFKPEDKTLPVNNTVYAEVAPGIFTGDLDFSGCSFDKAAEVFYFNAAGLVPGFNQALPEGVTVTVAEVLPILAIINFGEGSIDDALNLAIQRADGIPTADGTEFLSMTSSMSLDGLWLPAASIVNSNDASKWTLETAIATLKVSEDSSERLAGSVLALCSGLQQLTFASCYALWSTSSENAVIAGAQSNLALTLSSSLIGGSTPAERIEECEADVKDADIFATAQKMIPAAIAAAAVGTLVSFVAVGTNKMPAALVGGALSIIGGAILLGALLYVRTAPVYSKLEESAATGKEAGVPYYAAGTAQLLALAGIGAPILGGLLVIGSAFCGGNDEESSAMTSKVDNTY